MQSGKSLKDQGKSRTTGTYAECVRIWLSQSLKDQGKSRTSFAQNFALLTGSQSLKDQGKSRTCQGYGRNGHGKVAIP